MFDSNQTKAIQIEQWKKFLNYKGACDIAFNFHGNQTPQEAWDSCERADWMLWVLRRIEFKESDNIKFCKITLAFLQRSLKYVPQKKQKEVYDTIKDVMDWIKNPSEENRLKSHNNPYDASYAASYAVYSDVDYFTERKAQTKIIRKYWPKLVL